LVYNINIVNKNKQNIGGIEMKKIKTDKVFHSAKRVKRNSIIMIIIFVNLYLKDFIAEYMSKEIKKHYKSFIFIIGGAYEEASETVENFLDNCNEHQLADIAKEVAYDDSGAILDYIAHDYDFLLDTTDDDDIYTIFDQLPSIADDLELPTPECFLNDDYDNAYRLNSERRL
jgi:hypothetical protein